MAGLALYLWLFQRQITFGRAVVMVLPIVGAVVYLGLFYMLQPPAYTFPDAQASSLKALVPLPSEGRTLLNIAIGAMLNYAVYYIGYVVLLILLAGRRLGAVLRSQVPLLVLLGSGPTRRTPPA